MSTLATVMTLSEYFDTLKRTKLNYVVLSGYTDLPFVGGSTHKEPVVVLVDRIQQMVDLGPLTKIDGQKYKYPLAPVTDLESEPPYRQFLLIPKGHGCFPERFESEMLMRVEWYNEVIRIPQPDLLAFSHLYWCLFRTGLWKDQPERRRCLTQFVEDRVGPAMPCRVPLS